MRNFPVGKKLKCKQWHLSSFLAQLFIMQKNSNYLKIENHHQADKTAVLPAKNDSDFMFCLQSYHELRIDRSLVY